MSITVKFLSIKDGINCKLPVKDNDNLVSIRSIVIKRLWKTELIDESKVRFLLNDQILDVNKPLLKLINSQECAINCQIDNEINSEFLDVLDLNFVNSKESITYRIEVHRDRNLEELKLLISEILEIDISRINHQQDIEQSNQMVIDVEEKLRNVFILPLIEKGDRLTVKFSNMVSVQKLKNEIAQLINYDEKTFVLFHKFDHLDESKSVRDYNIENESTIKYCLYKKDKPLKKIGDNVLEGSFSKVYVAEDETKQMIMVKKYSITDLFNDDSFKPMIRELVSFALLEAHPNIVQLKAFYKKKKSFYMGMEYMVGGSLHDFVVRNKFITDEMIKKWSKQMLEGINYFHSKSLIHCDLKSSNVLLDEQNNIKISGFSLSKLYQGVNSELLSDGFTMSKPLIHNFMAPEGFDDLNKLGSKADIWSFGAILVELVTGVEPFQGKNLADIGLELRKNQTINYEYPSTKSYFFKQLIDKCLASDPQNRLSAAELLSMIELN